MKETKQLHVNINFRVFLINSKFLRMKGTKPLFFRNLENLKINPNLAVREHRLLQSFGIIVKKRTKMEMIEKKERNHFELEDIETFLKLSEYPKTWGARSNFKRYRESFSIENVQFLYK